MNRFLRPGLLLAAVLFARLSAQPLPPNRPATDKNMKPEETEIFQPVPAVVNAPAGGIPSDAIVLFDGSNLDSWQSRKGGPAPWKLVDGALVVEPKAGDIATKQAFGDIQLHLEFREPAVVSGDSQGRGNSGVFFMGLYELQVLDCFNNPTYVNGQAGALYKQSAPMVNASRRPGEWQTYDAVWIAPRFAADGGLISPAHLTVIHNGVLVQYDTLAIGPTLNAGHPKYVAHPDKLPLVLQEHHNPVAFRNIWVREITLPTVLTDAELKGDVTVVIAGNGSLQLNGKAVNDYQLSEAFLRLRNLHPDVSITVQAPERTQAKRLRFVMETAKENGLSKFALKTAD